MAHPLSPACLGPAAAWPMGRRSVSGKSRASILSLVPLCSKTRRGAVQSRKQELHLCGLAWADGRNEGEEQGQKRDSRLGAALKRKQQVLQERLRGLEPGELEKKLSQDLSYGRRFRLLDLIAERSVKGCTTIIAGITRLFPEETPEALGSRAAQYVEWGADAICVNTDEESTPDGLADLAAVVRAVQVPVLQRDWIIHPIQVVDALEAGASALSVVHCVLGKGTLSMLRAGLSAGLDTVVEVVNLKELEEVAPLGAPLLGLNVSVSLSLALPGFKKDIARSLVSEMPIGSASIVGVSSEDEAVALRVAGADAVLLRTEVLQGQMADPRRLLDTLSVKMTGDD